MATFYIDPGAALNGVGSFAAPYNTLPTLVAANTYLWKAGSVWNGRTSTWVPNVANLTLGVYDAITGERVTDGSQWALFDWRNSIPGSAASALAFGVNTSVGLDVQGLIVMAGWFVNHMGATYQSKAVHTADSSNEPGAGASWGTYWVRHDTVLLDSPDWVVGTVYQASGNTFRIYNPATSPIVKHIRTVGGATGVSIAAASIVSPHIEDIRAIMTWGAGDGCNICGTSGSPMANPTIKSVRVAEANGYGVRLQYINGSGAGMVIDDVAGERTKSSGVLFQAITGVHSISRISGCDSGNGFSIDSLCASLIIDGVTTLRNADNGVSGSDIFSSGHPPSNIEIRRYLSMFNGSPTATLDPANDGDGLSCHAGPGWVFDTGIAACNANSGFAHVGGAAGTIRNSIVTKNGYQPDGSLSPSRYKRGGVALVDSGVWVIENSIVEDNYPYDIKLSSPALLQADTNLIHSTIGKFTTDLSNNLDLDAFIALVAGGGGACTNVISGPALLDAANDYAPIRPGSPALRAGKGCGIGLLGKDYRGNQLPNPDGSYPVGAHGDYPPPRDGFSPWVHFDGSMPDIAKNSTINPLVAVFDGSPSANQITAVLNL